MPNMHQIMNEEIRRLARKEIKLAYGTMQKAISAYRHQIGDLKKELKDLKENLTVSVSEKKAEPVLVEEKKIRMTPAMITKLREKLGLNRKQFAQLISANVLSVCNWENGKTVPRMAQKQKIAALRSMGKREIKAQIQEKNIVIKVRKAKSVKKAAKKAAPASAPVQKEKKA